MHLYCFTRTNGCSMCKPGSPQSECLKSILPVQKLFLRSIYINNNYKPISLNVAGMVHVTVHVLFHFRCDYTDILCQQKSTQQTQCCGPVYHGTIDFSFRACITCFLYKLRCLCVLPGHSQLKELHLPRKTN